MGYIQIGHAECEAHTKLLCVFGDLIRAILGMRLHRVGANGNCCQALGLVVLCQTRNALCMRQSGLQACRRKHVKDGSAQRPALLDLDIG